MALARETYGSRTPASLGGTIDSVDGGSPAERAGLREGDTVMTADGHALRDIIDWRWYADDVVVDLGVTRAGIDEDSAEAFEVSLERTEGESWGVEFTAPVFDAVRTCRNACAFCFMSQLPRGLRPALYLRDDDFRLSFLQGNFVTLTNLADEDVQRIREQRLSPLHVSMHAVDPAVRERLVCAREDRGVERAEELLSDGIRFHVQIVLVPDENDGDVLEETLSWLYARQGIESVGVVPLGYTRFQSTLSRSFESPEDSAAVIEQLHLWRARASRERDTRWVYAADEFYLNAGIAVPPADEYDDFPQYENGIGLVRSFLDEWDEADSPQRGDYATALPTLVTGTLFAPVLERLVAREGRTALARILPVKNRFFGGNVSVTGLLTAHDICEAVRRDGGAGTYVVPDTVLNDDGLLLDDVPADELSSRAEADVRVVPSVAGALRAALAELAGSDITDR